MVLDKSTESYSLLAANRNFVHICRTKGSIATRDCLKCTHTVMNLLLFACQILVLKDSYNLFYCMINIDYKNTAISCC